VLAPFLQGLAQDGRAIIAGAIDSPSRRRDEEAVGLLQDIECKARSELAYEPPAFCPNSALWAATLFYQGCRFAVCRDIGEQEVVATLATPCPEHHSPATDWSVDLTFRHLPVLFRFARQLSSADPLVTSLRQLAAEWPLSSVGIAALGEVNIDSFISHPALRRLYADRIMAAADASRLGDPRVDDLLRADVGVHREMAGPLARQLFADPAENDLRHA
jgi:hypothetical protein